MTIEKVCKDIETSYRKEGLGEPPPRTQLKNVLIAFAMLSDAVEDPDCVYFTKVANVLDDVAHDRRNKDD